MAEEVGKEGVGMDIDSSIKVENVVLALRDKIYHPDNYLPVKDVLTRPSDDGQGVYREMTLG